MRGESQDLRWRAQFALAPACRLRGFHRVDKLDHALMNLIAQGKMRPVIDRVLPLEQAREGLRIIAEREVIGKVVVTP